VTNGAMGLGFAVCGALLAWHCPRNPIGWLFPAAGVADATSAAAPAAPPPRRPGRPHRSVPRPDRS